VDGAELKGTTGIYVPRRVFLPVLAAPPRTLGVIAAEVEPVEGF
jgi:hypothetical protein